MTCDLQASPEKSRDWKIKSILVPCIEASCLIHGICRRQAKFTNNRASVFVHIVRTHPLEDKDINMD